MTLGWRFRQPRTTAAMSSATTSGIANNPILSSSNSPSNSASSSSSSSADHTKEVTNLPNDESSSNTVQPLEESSPATATTTPVLTGTYQRPSRVILDELPVVYCYDHCPFCVRVRCALGLKNIKHRLVFLANDDVTTPTRLIGTKMTPIFQWTPANLCMPESMDIIQYLDSDETFGPMQQIQTASGRTDLAEWQSSVRDLLRTLQRPRYVATGLLPEFQQLEGRQAFIRNHELPPYTKQEWKTAMSDEEKWIVYAEAMAKDPAADLEELNRKLVELSDKLASEYAVNPPGSNGRVELSYDDIDLWSRLRSITIIKGVIWPTKLRRYMDHLSELSDVPLYDEMAL